MTLLRLLLDEGYDVSVLSVDLSNLEILFKNIIWEYEEYGIRVFTNRTQFVCKSMECPKTGKSYTNKATYFLAHVFLDL